MEFVAVSSRYLRVSACLGSPGRVGGGGGGPARYRGKERRRLAPVFRHGENEPENSEPIRLSLRETGEKSVSPRYLSRRLRRRRRRVKRPRSTRRAPSEDNTVRGRKAKHLRLSKRRT